ncbi:MAG: thiamine phosphate synthase [Burkholderiales bacterium]
MHNKAGRADRDVVRGLYAITPDDLPASTLFPLLDALFADGLRLLQIRRKGTDRTSLEAEARQIVALAAPHDACVIVNDDLELALACGAHGVHWGRDDAPYEVTALRAQIKQAKSHAAAAEAFLVGISCYDNFERAEMAHAAGADYVAFGSFFASSTKPHAVRADLGLLRQARDRRAMPAVAIGGVTRDNASTLVEAGASAIAVISDLFAPPNSNAADTAGVVSRARVFHRLFADQPAKAVTTSS